MQNVVWLTIVDMATKYGLGAVIQSLTGWRLVNNYQTNLIE